MQLMGLINMLGSGGKISHLQRCISALSMEFKSPSKCWLDRVRWSIYSFPLRLGNFISVQLRVGTLPLSPLSLPFFQRAQSSPVSKGSSWMQCSWPARAPQEHLKKWLLYFANIHWTSVDYSAQYPKFSALEIFQKSSLVQLWKIVLSDAWKVHRRGSTLPDLLIQTQVAEITYRNLLLQNKVFLSSKERWRHAWKRCNKGKMWKLKPNITNNY